MASKRRQRRHACQRKRRFEKDEAFRIALAMRQRQPPGEPAYDAYPCKGCGGWHIGKRPRYIQNKIKTRKMSRG